MQLKDKVRHWALRSWYRVRILLGSQNPQVIERYTVLCIGRVDMLCKGMRSDAAFTSGLLHYTSGVVFARHGKTFVELMIERMRQEADVRRAERPNDVIGDIPDELADRLREAMAQKAAASAEPKPILH